MTRYPRDLHGHGPTLPRAVRPDAATIALGHKDGGENTIRHEGDAFTAAPLGGAGAPPRPEPRHWNGEAACPGHLPAEAGRPAATMTGPRAKALLP